MPTPPDSKTIHATPAPEMLGTIVDTYRIFGQQEPRTGRWHTWAVATSDESVQFHAWGDDCETARNGTLKAYRRYSARLPED